MAILEKEVWVGLGGNKNMKHFEKLGYTIPKILNSYGKLITPVGTKILVKVEHLLSGNVEVTKVCDECGKQMPKQMMYAILNGRKADGKDRCFDCGNRKSSKTLLSKIKYEDSLEKFAIESNKYYLINEYSDKNEKKSSEVARASVQKYLWNCPECNSEYIMSASNRTRENCNCPFCAGKQVNHTNCLWTVAPEIANLLKHKDNGYKLTTGSNKLTVLICPDCGHEQKKSPNDITQKGFSCSRCSDGISYGEKFMINLLEQLNIDYQKEKIFNWLENRRYDFYIPSLNCIIETHGLQHYGGTFGAYGGRTLEEEKANDELKMKSALANGIENYIVINCSKSNKEFIKNSILNSRLSILFNLQNINWEKCHEFALNYNSVKRACELWNLGIGSTVVMGEIMKLERSSVVRYLKQGNILGWCRYDSLKVNKIEIVQLSLEGELIKIWESASEAGRSLGISHSCISAVCRGKRKSTRHFKWMTKENYDKLILENM